MFWNEWSQENVVEYLYVFEGERKSTIVYFMLQYPSLYLVVIVLLLCKTATRRSHYVVENDSIRFCNKPDRTQ